MVWRQLNQVPATAPWLPEDERRWLVETLAANRWRGRDVHGTLRAASPAAAVGAGGRLLLGRAGHLRRELLAAADPPGAGHGVVGHAGPRLRDSLRRRRGGDGGRRRPFGPHRRTALARGALGARPGRRASRWRPWCRRRSTLSLAALSLAAMGVWGTLGSVLGAADGVPHRPRRGRRRRPGQLGGQHRRVRRPDADGLHARRHRDVRGRAVAAGGRAGGRCGDRAAACRAAPRHADEAIEEPRVETRRPRSAS